MPLGVKLEFSIDGFCRSLIRKGFMRVFVTAMCVWQECDTAAVVFLILLRGVEMLHYRNRRDSPVQDSPPPAVGERGSPAAVPLAGRFW